MGFFERVDAELRELLNGVEELDPIWEIEKNIEIQEWALRDSGPWSIGMTFVREVEDGKLETIVYSSPHSASVRLVLDPARRNLRLAELSYQDGHESHLRDDKVSRTSVEYVRTWVRRKALPELQAAKSRRDELARQAASELEAMRKKYMP